jgi:hypothetical protein
MILLGSAILFALGMLVLLVQAIRIAFSLAKIAYYLAKLPVCLVVLAVCAVCLVVQYALGLVRRLDGKPEPAVTIDFSAGAEDAPTIELPRASFRRLRG